MLISSPGIRCKLFVLVGPRGMAPGFRTLLPGSSQSGCQHNYQLQLHDELHRRPSHAQHAPSIEVWNIHLLRVILSSHVPVGTVPRTRD